MTTKKKLLVVFIFLAGFVVTGISIARLVVFTQATEENFTCKSMVCFILWSCTDTGLLQIPTLK